MITPTAKNDTMENARQGVSRIAPEGVGTDIQRMPRQHERVAGMTSRVVPSGEETVEEAENNQEHGEWLPPGEKEAADIQHQGALARGVQKVGDVPFGQGREDPSTYEGWQGQRYSVSLNNSGDSSMESYMQQQHREAVQHAMMMMSRQVPAFHTNQHNAQEIATIGSVATSMPPNIEGGMYMTHPMDMSRVPWGGAMHASHPDQHTPFMPYEQYQSGMKSPNRAQSQPLPTAFANMGLGIANEGAQKGAWAQGPPHLRWQGQQQVSQTHSQMFNNNHNGNGRHHALDGDTMSNFEAVHGTGMTVSPSDSTAGQYLQSAHVSPQAHVLPMQSSVDTSRNAPQQGKQQQQRGYYGQNGNGKQRHGGERGKGQDYKKLWQQVTSVNRGGRLSAMKSGSGGSDTTVEQLVDMVMALPPDASAVAVVHQGLYGLDPGALAALLKELNRNRQWRRSQEIFDWLRQLNPSHPLYPLCTTMTYTTMISQCGPQQALRRALELVAEMRGRGIQCNVHTYSALMNVCIKAGELDLALDVYRQMLNEGCTPNLVTYNTLIDVYGKTGAWEDAIAVLDDVEEQGLEPEARTYNTVIIACNQSSRAAEALQVYERMLRANAKPTATTYTALISAYGKSGQLDAAMQIFRDMAKQGCERNVITYSSLISACEKAGRWQLALDLFKEMHSEGCEPNVVTYNSLIAACAQGSQAAKAQEIFELMQKRGCRPDSVTFGALIGAYDKSGNWRSALSSFEAIRGASCRPDTVVYNTIIGCLWKTGILSAQQRATRIFHVACRQGHFRMTVASDTDGTPPHSPVLSGANSRSPLCSPKNSLTLSLDDGSSDLHSSPRASFELERRGSDCKAHCLEFGMHAFTIGSAILCIMRWLVEVRSRILADGVANYDSLAVVLNKGKPSREHTYPAIKTAIMAKLDAWGAPLELFDIPIGCRIVGTKDMFVSWINSNSKLNEEIREYLSFIEQADKACSNDVLYQDDAICESRCMEAFEAVRGFETMQANSRLKMTDADGDSQRDDGILEEEGPSTWLSVMQQLAESCCYPQEVLYDGYDILERAVNGNKSLLMSVSINALAAACLSLAAKQCGCIDDLSAAVVCAAEQAVGITKEDIRRICGSIEQTLEGNTSSISSLRVLKLYLERLGTNFSQPSMKYLAGDAFSILPIAVGHANTMMYRPSVLAAAILIAGRKHSGISPFWPQALEHMTGLRLTEDVEFQSAVNKIDSLIEKEKKIRFTQFK